MARQTVTPTSCAGRGSQSTAATFGFQGNGSDEPAAAAELAAATLAADLPKSSAVRLKNLNDTRANGMFKKL
ncbi:hypothetical protein thalar_02181 [Litoreibacter arenae DSM 19593]|uniref:Uncharacterized protein n=1 Tax=Litoreibacter arenae DSM 19593 TaxID=1123360 RepID=S9QD43_9RHOB|nr:hypothetical protein thalar_02181 [Litoreibacter arenae DSM 19593]